MELLRDIENMHSNSLITIPIRQMIDESHEMKT
jgi:hypothetical protein